MSVEVQFWILTAKYESEFFISRTACKWMLFCRTRPSAESEFCESKKTIRQISLNNCPRLRKKIIVLTGANSGIGKETAKIIAKTECILILGCRCEAEGVATAKEIVYSSGNNQVLYSHLDLSSFKSIASFAEQVLKQANEDCELHCLVNNAGIFYNKHELTEDGFNLSLQVNYLGPVYLTLLLLPKLKESSSARVINITSEAHKLVSYPHIETFFSGEFFTKNPFDPIPVYGETKLYIILFSSYLAQTLKETKVAVNCIDPGNVTTNILRYFKEYNTYLTRFLIWLRFKTAAKAAVEVASLILHPAFAEESGKVWKSLEEETVSSLASSEELAQQLWLQTLAGIPKTQNTE